LFTKGGGLSRFAREKIEKPLKQEWTTLLQPTGKYTTKRRIEKKE
jgi:hypothetical protein